MIISVFCLSEDQIALFKPTIIQNEFYWVSGVRSINQNSFIFVFQKLKVTWELFKLNFLSPSGFQCHFFTGVENVFSFNPDYFVHEFSVFEDVFNSISHSVLMEILSVNYDFLSFWRAQKSFMHCDFIQTVTQDSNVLQLNLRDYKRLIQVFCQNWRGVSGTTNANLNHNLWSFLLLKETHWRVQQLLKRRF